MAEQIRTILVDDEKSSLITLEKLLIKYCPEVHIIDTSGSVEKAISIIEKEKPELVFLDISMPDGDGFEVIERSDYKSFEVIFITGYDRYAIRAFEFAALHYLLKPIDHNDLLEAINRFKNRTKTEHIESKLKILNDNINNKSRKIILPSSDGLIVVELDDIIRCESSNNYTTFYMVKGEKYVISKSINGYESLLCDIHFARIHSKHLINLKYVKKYVKGRGGYVVLQDNSNVDVSEGKKKDFLRQLNEYASL
jgi:two-component system, LytTR family, response regulator